MIPKVLHQIWIGDNKMPPIFLDFRKKWWELHPDWSYKLWTDSNINELDIPIDYLNLKVKSSIANVIRLYVVYKFGGVYADTDMDWLKSLNPLLNCHAFCGLEADNSLATFFNLPVEKMWYVGNAIFGAEAQHHWLEWQINKLFEFIKHPAPWGPRLMTIAADKFKQDIEILPKEAFFPYDYENKKMTVFPSSYASHQWSRSWSRQ